MKENRWLTVAAVVVFVLGSVLIGRTVYQMYNKGAETVVDDGVSAELKRIRAEDLAVLKENKADAMQIAKSLSRYADQNLPEGLPLIRQYLTDERAEVRAAALEAAGAYGEADFFKALSEALLSEEMVIRIGALKGLGRRAEEDRRMLLAQYLEKAPSDNGEWLEAYLAKYKISIDENERVVVRDEILRRANNFPLELQNQAYEELIITIPNANPLIELSKKILLSKDAAEKRAKLLIPAFNYTLAYAKEWFATEITSLPMHADYGYQYNLLQLLAERCPKGTQEVVEKLKDTSLTKLNSGDIEQSGVLTKCQKH